MKYIFCLIILTSCVGNYLEDYEKVNINKVSLIASYIRRFHRVCKRAPSEEEGFKPLTSKNAPPTCPNFEPIPPNLDTLLVDHNSVGYRYKVNGDKFYIIAAGIDKSFDTEDDVVFERTFK